MGQYERQTLQEEVLSLRARVAEYEELMRAIRAGEVDALFVGQGDDCRALTFGEAESSYRALVEAMSEGAAIVLRDGTLLYCNSRFAAMLEKPLEAVMGASLLKFVAHGERAGAARLLAAGLTRPVSRELTLRKGSGGFVPVQWSVSPLACNGHAGVCVVATDLTERYRVQEALRSLSLVDELTGLFNRRGFLMHAEQQLKLARRIDGQLLLVFADLDGLKPINDMLGHQAGDNAIRDAAEALRRSFRESDILARLGGDEFAVLATATDGHAVEVIRDRLQQHIDAHNGRGERPYQLSLSVGIVPYDPANPAPVDELLTRADAAMYEDKRERRGPDSRSAQRVMPLTATPANLPVLASERVAGPETGVWEWTRAENRVRWSAEAREMLGIARADGTLRSCLKVLHADDRVRVVRQARRALASRCSFVSQFRVQGGDRRARLVASRVHGEFAADGSLCRLLGTLTDCSAFVAASELAQATLDSINASLCVLDGDSRIVAINRAWRDFARTHGVPDPDRHLGLRYLDICAADDGPQQALSRQLCAGIVEVIGGRQPHFEQDYPCHGPDARRWFNVSVARFDLAGCTRVMVRHQEITDTVLIEDCLSDTLHPEAAPGQHARDGIFIVQEQRIVFVNHAFAQMLSAATDRLIGLRFTDLLTPAHARQWRARIALLPGRHAQPSTDRLLLQAPDSTRIAATVTITHTQFNGAPALLGTLHAEARTPG